MGHTKGPWVFHGTKTMDIRGNIHRVGSQDRYPTAFVPAWNDPKPGQIDGADEALANAARIVSCVNACEPFADPSVAPELLQAVGFYFDNYLQDEAASLDCCMDAEHHEAAKAVAEAIARARGQS